MTTTKLTALTTLKTITVKEIKSTFYSIVVIAILTVWCWFFICRYQYAFNYETNLNGQYLTAVLISVPVAILLLCKVKRPYFSFELMIVYCLMASLVAWPLFANGVKYASDEYAINIVSFSMAYLIFTNLEVKLLKKALVVYVIFWFYELFLAYQQIQTTPDFFNGLSVQGSFLNSGVMACFLSFQLPIIVYVLSLTRHKLESKLLNRKRLVSIAYYGCLTILVGGLIYIDCYVQSRSSLLVLVVVAIGYLYLNFKDTLKKYITEAGYLTKMIFLFLTPLSIAYLGHYLFYLKKLSAMGRFMKLHIAWQHVADHFWFGTGLGRFTWYYPQWQAAYFSNHIDFSSVSFLIADEGYVLFNEYLQLFETIGCIGFFGLVILLCYFFSAKSKIHRNLLANIKLTVIGTFLLGLFSYPFHVNIILLMFSFFFATTEVIRSNKFKLNINWFNFPMVKKAITLAFMLVLTSFTFFNINQYFYYEKWDFIRHGFTSSRMNNKVSYNQIYPALKCDGKFLFDYGAFLMQDSADYPLAVIVLEEAKKKLITSEIISSLGKAYLQLENYPKAIENYKWLVDFIPNRFEYKYNLLLLYKKAGDYKNAENMRRTILTMPVKIPSAEVERIKSAARKLTF